MGGTVPQYFLDSASRAKLLWLGLWEIADSSRKATVDLWYARAILLMAYRPYVEELHTAMSASYDRDARLSAERDFEDRWNVSLAYMTDRDGFSKRVDDAVVVLGEKELRAILDEASTQTRLAGCKAICSIDFSRPMPEILREIEKIGEGRKMPVPTGVDLFGDTHEQSAGVAAMRGWPHRHDLQILTLHGQGLGVQAIFDGIPKTTSGSDRTWVAHRLNAIRIFVDKNNLRPDYWDGHQSRRKKKSKTVPRGTKKKSVKTR